MSEVYYGRQHCYILIRLAWWVMGSVPRLASMTDKLRLRIAGIDLALSWEGSCVADVDTWKIYAPFILNGRRPPEARTEARLKVHCGELPDLKPDALIFDALPHHWRLFRAN